MELTEYQLEIQGLAQKLCQKLFDLGESMDLNPDLAIHAIPQAAAYCVVSLLAAQDELPLLDDVLVAIGDDFALSLRKIAATDAPEQLSGAFKLETGRIDRELKRRRRMSNAPPPGEA